MAAPEYEGQSGRPRSASADGRASTADDDTAHDDTAHDGPAETSEFVERFAANMVDGGMPRMASRVFAWLLSRDDGAGTASDLSASLQASPAAISGAVRYLIQLHLVIRGHRPGDRKDVYKLQSDRWYELLGNRDHELRRWVQLSREGQAIVGAGTPAGRRLGETAAFFEFLAAEMQDLMRRWGEQSAGAPRR